MQSKLNEILELCIEKSNRETYIFYQFSLCNISDELTINKMRGYTALLKQWDLVDIDQALEYMQNE